MCYLSVFGLIGLLVVICVVSSLIMIVGGYIMARIKGPPAPSDDKETSQDAKVDNFLC